MTDKPNYYGILPAFVRYAKIPDGAKVFYAELTALTNKESFCWATNKYFQELYDVGERAVQRWLLALSEIGAVRVKVTGSQRKIYLVYPVNNGGNYPVKNDDHNNTRDNTRTDSLRSSVDSVAIAPSSIVQKNIKSSQNKIVHNSKPHRIDLEAPKLPDPSHGITQTIDTPRNGSYERTEASDEPVVAQFNDILKKLQSEPLVKHKKGNEFEMALWSVYPSETWDFNRERRAIKQLVKHFGLDTVNRIIWGYIHLRDTDSWWDRVEPRFSAWSYKLCNIILERI